MPKVLVTGAAGFIGSHLCETLLGEGFEVEGVDCFTDYYDRSLKEANLQRCRTSSSFHFVDGDLAIADLSPLVEGVETIYHLAGQPGVRLSWSAFDRYVDWNLLATQRLAAAAVETHSRPRFVYSSSSSIYGDTETYPTLESAAPRPFSPYGVTKLAGEQLLSSYARNFDLSVIALRYFTVYGPRQRPDMAFTRILAACLEGSEFKIFGSGKQVRDFTFVQDVVRANLLAGAASSDLRGAFNVSGGSSHDLLECIQIIEDILQRRVRVIHEAAAPGDVPRTGGDNSAAATQLGWIPQWGLEQGLRAQAEWALEGCSN